MYFNADFDHMFDQPVRKVNSVLEPQALRKDFGKSKKRLEKKENEIQARFDTKD